MNNLIKKLQHKLKPYAVATFFFILIVVIVPAITININIINL
ncbi:hypothetical protein [Lactobacillus sp. ESL0263]|nr:hypothetical protein [Lactobacillus sp. ESL0263]